jgi:hypothetical protein
MYRELAEHVFASGEEVLNSLPTKIYYAVLCFLDLEGAYMGR